MKPTSKSVKETPEMVEITFTVCPFVTETGTIKIPKSLPRSEWKQYLNDHWNEIIFTEDDRDYCGVDIDFD